MPNIFFNDSGEECLGSAKIERVGPSHYAMNVNNCKDELDKKRQNNGNGVKKIETQCDDVKK